MGRENNFGLIRLLAALEVMFIHLAKVFDVSSVSLNVVDALLPGVPIFFFISGYLVSASYIRDRDTQRYILSRASRLLPGLCLCVIFSAIMVAVLHPIDQSTMFLWILGQITLLQTWHPEQLRTFGTGVVNASLWTLPVEALFYAALPLIIAWAFKGRKLARLLLLTALSFGVYFTVKFVLLPMRGPDDFAYKVLNFSPISVGTWLWMFLLGVIAQVAQKPILQVIRDRTPIFAFLYVAVAVPCLWGLEVPGVLALAPFGVINFILLALMLLAFAHSPISGFTQRLDKHDISYGIYLYHLPVANLLLTIGYSGWKAVALATAISCVMAGISWTLVERPALRLRELGYSGEPRRL